MAAHTAPVGTKLITTLLVAGGLLSLNASYAASYRPASDNQIVDILPAGSLTYQQLNIAATTSSTTQPKQPFEQVQPRIDALLQQAYQRGDPRLLGMAEAMLQPYQNDKAASVRISRANIYQATHRFKEARQELLAILQQIPNQGDSLLMLASIDTVQGNFAAARKSCQQITDPGLLVIRLACSAQIDSMTGKLKQSAATLQQLLQLNSGLTPEQQRWLYLMLADMALRLDDPVMARQVFMQLDRDSAPALASRADWLLAHQAWGLARGLLVNHTDNDSLLLRLAFAEQQLAHPDAARHRELLSERLQVWQQRGETAHQREQAQFALWFGSAEQALQLARLNWQKQRESADFAIYAQAAIRANSTDDLKALQQWLTGSGFEYPQLALQIKRLANQAGK